jgi:hypothetical protein
VHSVKHKGTPLTDQWRSAKLAVGSLHNDVM